MMKLISKKAKLFGWTLRTWAELVATLQTILCILSIFHLLNGLGVLPFSLIYNNWKDAERVEARPITGAVDITCSVIFIFLNLIGGAMAMMLQDGAREGNIDILWKWIRFAVFSLLITVILDLIQLEAMFQKLEETHLLGLGFIVLIQTGSILIIRFYAQELLLLQTSPPESVSVSVIKV